MIRADHHSKVIGWRWPHFTPVEMSSRVDGSILIDPKFLDWLECVRAEFGRPMPVSSGYRTAEQQKQLTGRTDGAHVAGQAADILCFGEAAERLERIAIGKHVLGRGISQAAGTEPRHRYLHLDLWTVRTARMVWSY